ncbi:PREDICTED: progesterone receptor [Elephantulus edwardii]|uniref:progesterone receptor n=1 Tax=Elephantulus edwardii TaxID=28737 RepID=UPI0003F06460|nr:PREDICTED: progesterone receptor [Elephantulus edwardii]
MTELKAKDPRAPHVAGGAPSPIQVGSPLLGRSDDPFQGSQISEDPPVVSALPISLDGLLFPRPCQGQDPQDVKTPDHQSLSDVEGEFPCVETAPGAGGGSARPPEKDSGLLDSVLDTLLATPGPGHSQPSPPACEATNSWCLFGPELPEDPRPVPATQGALPPAMSRPGGKVGDIAGAVTTHNKAMHRGLSPSRQLLPPAPGAPQWPPMNPSPQPPTVEVEEEDGPDPEGSAGSLLKSKSLALGSAASGGGAVATVPGAATGGVALVPKEDSRFSAPRVNLAEQDAPVAPGRSSLTTSLMDFIHVPILPLNPAFLAARTRQLLEGESYDGGAATASAFAAPRGSPSASSTPGASGDFPDCAYPPDAEPKDDAFPLYGDFQPPTLKIKEEEEGAEAARRPPRSYLVAGANAAPPLGLNGLPQLGYQAAVLKEGLPQVYPQYLNYLRPDSEASQSPQYSFESLPQKICLICGDEASGCHYGVLTCGSCKVFFKRAMEGQHNYLCAGRNDCIVDKIRRKNCPACRLRKCCQAGMVLGGRKFKKFNKVRVMRALDAVTLPQPVGIPNENQALSQRITFSPNQEIQLIPPLINLLMSIEPDVIYAGYDNTKPDTSSSLLTSLNQLGERQLLSVVKWSKSLPGFRNLHIDDQITLIQYSWMSLMVFGLGWRSYKHVSGQMLYFAPDLILNEQRMKESSIYSLCLTMWQIPQEFVKLQVSQEEFLCMKVLLLLNTIPLEGLRSQNQFEEMRSSYIRELIKAIGLRQKGVVSSSQRFYQLTKLLDNLHDLVKQLHLYCLNTFIQSRALSVEFPEMMSEVIAAQLPKILAGMVKPLLFHKK